MRQCISVWVFHDSDHQLISSDCSQVKYSLKFYCLDFQVRGFVGVGFFSGSVSLSCVQLKICQLSLPQLFA